MLVNEKELKKKREWFERSYASIKNDGGYFVYVQVASAAIWTTSYGFRGDDKTVFLFSKDALGNDTLVAIVYNIMDIEDVY